MNEHRTDIKFENIFVSYQSKMSRVSAYQPFSLSAVEIKTSYQTIAICSISIYTLSGILYIMIRKRAGYTSNKEHWWSKAFAFPKRSPKSQHANGTGLKGWHPHPLHDCGRLPTPEDPYGGNFFKGDPLGELYEEEWVIKFKDEYNISMIEQGTCLLAVDKNNGGRIMGYVLAHARCGLRSQEGRCQ